MKESKILKAISYILIPSLILILGLSLFYEFGKDAFIDEFDEAEYFNSDDFLILAFAETDSLNTVSAIISGLDTNILSSNTCVFPVSFVRRISAIKCAVLYAREII